MKDWLPVHLSCDEEHGTLVACTGDSDKPHVKHIFMWTSITGNVVLHWCAEKENEVTASRYSRVSKIAVGNSLGVMLLTKAMEYFKNPASFDAKFDEKALEQAQDLANFVGPAIAMKVDTQFKIAQREADKETFKAQREADKKTLKKITTPRKAAAVVKKKTTKKAKAK